MLRSFEQLADPIEGGEPERKIVNAILLKLPKLSKMLRKFLHYKDWYVLIIEEQLRNSIFRFPKNMLQITKISQPVSLTTKQNIFRFAQVYKIVLGFHGIQNLLADN